jgi:exodeoxyribonuclease V alpha subunit
MQKAEESNGQVELVGVLEKIVYTSEETHFTVARLRCEEDENCITIVGTIMSSNEGLSVRVRGTWQSHPKYGRQLNVENFELVLPSDKEAIEKYLASGVIKGIGECLAKRIVQRFGTEVFDVLDKKPENLRQVHGIGKKKLKQIETSWKVQRESHTAMVFLADYGLGGARAVKIYRQYGGNLFSVVKEHPYRLAIDIDGIGFITADRIAQKSGIANDDPERIQAAILHVLGEATAQGHCFLPQEELVETVAKLLLVDTGKIEDNLTRLSPELVHRLDQGNRPVYAKALFVAEQMVATLLQKLLAHSQYRQITNLEKRISQVEREMKLTFRQAQRQAIIDALMQKICIVTGGPGVGKTTIIKALVQILEQEKQRVALAAPTGRAAKRLSEASGRAASTIHRLLHYNPREHGFEYSHGKTLDIDHLIVDEISMLDIPLAAHLFSALATSTSVTLVGDADQLPSVGPGNFLQDCLLSQKIPVVRLNYIFRQAAGSSIVEVAHMVNGGIVPQIQNQAKNDIFFLLSESAEAGAATIVDLVANRLPRQYSLHPLSEIQVLTPMYRGSVGADNLNEVLAAALNANGHNIGNRFREGDKVMQIVNNYDKDIFNGDIGVITTHNRVDQTLTIVFDGRAIAYQEAELDELVRAYAISIHKSQGSEYPAVIIPLFTAHYIMLERNLLYTAITRGKQLVILVGSYKALGIAVRTIRARNRYTRLSQLL